MESYAGDYASHDFSARTRDSLTPRSGFVQPAFRGVMTPMRHDLERGGWSRGGRPVSCPTHSLSAGCVSEVQVMQRLVGWLQTRPFCHDRLSFQLLPVKQTILRS